MAINKDVNPVNFPHYGAGTVEVQVDEKNGTGYAVLFAPDPNNNKLREAGLPMQFYYYPKAPRLARHPDGRFKFSMQMYKGMGDGTTSIGKEGFKDEGGAYTTFTSTIDIPEEQLKIALDHLQETLQKQFGSFNGGLKGLFNIGKNKLSPSNVRPIQLIENKVAMHILGEKEGEYYWTRKIQGAGEGQTFGLGENAFSILLGTDAASVVKASLVEGGNDLIVENTVKYKAYMPTMRIKTTVDAKKVHDYFSSKVSGGDIISLSWEHEYEKLITDASIQSEIFCDETLTPDDMKKLKETTLTQQRDNAFKALQKQIFESEDKKFDPAKDPKGKKVKILFWDLELPAVSLKSGKEIRELHYSDEVSYIGIYSLSSVISGNLDPLISKDEKNPQEVLKQYIQEVSLDEDFSKIHVVAHLAGQLAVTDKEGNIKYSPVQKVSIEVGYPDSHGQMIWKSSGRKIPADGSGNPLYVTQENRRTGEIVDALFPAIWASNNVVGDQFVFDFVRNKDNKMLPKLRRKIVYAKTPNVCVEDSTEEFDIQGSDCLIEFPAIRMLDYRITPETLFACDTLEITIKADQVGTQQIVFNEENCDDAVPFQVWYDKDVHVEPVQYKLKYTCKGKVGKHHTLKKETIKTDWIDLDFEKGDINIQIPEGTEIQNKTIDSIRKQFYEEEEEE